MSETDQAAAPGEAMQAARALARLLEEENAALAACDLLRATEAAAHKAALVQRLRRALERPGEPPGESTAERAAADRAVAERLRTLAQDNKRLLERALAIQGQVIGILVRAMPSSRVGYARPSSTASGTALPVSICARV